MPRLFGTDGIRGKVNGEVINAEFAYKLGQTLVDYCFLKSLKPVIAIGRDTRESGSLLERAVGRGVALKGGTVISAGIITTPGIAFTVKNEQASLGLMISASHNPFDYNGFKFFKNDGTKPTDAEEEEIEQLVKSGSWVAAEQSFTKTEAGNNFSARAEEYVNKYADFLLNNISGADFQGLKIVLDCAHGATSGIAPRTFKKLGAEVITIFDNPDGRNINHDCGSQFTENLEKEVLKHRADIGLAFDGDGDRLVAVTEKGWSVSGDHLMFVFSKMFLEKNVFGKKVIVSTAMSNLGFIQALKELGISHITSPEIGDRSVFFEMRKQGAILGGEEAGHIIFSDILAVGDGLLSGLMLVRAVKHFNLPLSELAGQLNLFPKVLINVPVGQKKDLSLVPRIKKVIKETENRLGGEGRVLVRYSGTEPLCRVMIEGKNEKMVNNLARKIASVIETDLN